MNLNIDLTERKTIPNQPPGIGVDYKLAIIVSNPTREDYMYNQLLSGKEGLFLNRFMSGVGILREGCFVGSLYRSVPPGTGYYQIDKSSEAFLEDQRTLREELLAFGPNCVLLIGEEALNNAKGFDKPVNKIDEWRGSLFTCEVDSSPFFGFKCLATYTPAHVFKTYSDHVFLLFDLGRALNEAESPELETPRNHIRVNLTTDEIIDRLRAIKPGSQISPDIEGVLGAWTLIGIADTPSSAFVIDWNALSEDDEMRVMVELSRVMWNPDIVKILQNGMYDNFVTTYGYKMFIRNAIHDTMIANWEIYPEMRKDLGTLASIWTKQPYYKVSHSVAARKKRASDPMEWLRYREYCGTDCCTTYAISLRQRDVLSGDALDHYKFNIDLNNPIMYMQLKGMRYDTELAAQRLAEVNLALQEAHIHLSVRTNGMNLTGPKGSLVPQRLANLLYGSLGLPPQYKKERGRKTDKLTTDVDALLNLCRTHDHPILQDILKIRKLEKWKETLEIKTDPDGRTRAAYSQVGTETGRFNCKTSPTGSGANLTTITKKYRDLYLADAPDERSPEGYDFAQFDLSGADGWTVAARIAQLGDPTMYEDLLVGIKPAKVIALAHKYGGEVNLWSQEKILEASHEINSDGWLYAATKAVFHGSNYQMYEGTMSVNILKRSYKDEGVAIYVPPKDCKVLQGHYLNGRYRGIKLWHQWAERQMLQYKRLKSASGHTRTFFGRIKTNGQTDRQTLREFLSHEPQNNTTYATNLAAKRLWDDPENRYDDNFDLIVFPCHQVHDALCVQWPKSRREWAIKKVQQWFDNEITVGDMKIVIPFEGAYGPSWGELPNEIKFKK